MMFKSLTIKNKLLIFYMSITALTMAFALAITMSINFESAKKNIVSGLNIVGGIVADRCAASIAFSDIESAKNNLNSLALHDSIVYACIRTVDNIEFAEYNPNISQAYQCDSYDGKLRIETGGGYINIYKPIVIEQQAVGVLQIKASLNELNERSIKSGKISVFIFVVLLFLAGLLSRRVARMIIGPITDLKEISQKVTENKDYSLRMEKKTDDEAGVLVESFNNMLDQIQDRDSALIEAKDRAEISAESAKKHAKETEVINVDLEVEIKERLRIEDELKDLNDTLEDKVSERTSELKKLNDKIGGIARSAGMAEVASGVLHNVGNVLNSVNVSASIMREKIRKTKAGNLSKVVGMIGEHKNDIADFMANDEKGKQIPKFLMLLSDQLINEKEDLFSELDGLADNIDHIKNVISMQQSYAGNYGVREKVALSDLSEDALKINSQGSLSAIEIIKNYSDMPLLYLDKHKALQVIINLISNAKYALVDCEHENKKIFITTKQENNMALIEIKDTGIGIEEKDIPHLFEYGFKKRRGGHGFGLHHSALVANELGGKITVFSRGLGEGASFVLSVPLVDKQGKKDEV